MGREASRNAAKKINGQAASQNGSTPTGSRKGTPAATSSPQKRGTADFDDEDEEDDRDESETPKKKKRKKAGEGKGKAKAKPKGEVKKWKSGKVTVDGKPLQQPVEPEQVPAPAPALNAEAEKMKRSESATGSGSSHTMPSPL